MLILLGFFLPILFSFVWFYISGSFREYLTAAFLQNVGYLSSWRTSSSNTPFFIKNAPLLVRGLIILLGILILSWKRTKIPKQFTLICLWLLFSLFAVTLSERPYPHYLIQSIAPVSFLLALLFTDKTIIQVLTIIPLTLFFLVPLYFKYWIYSPIKYYGNFINFIAGKASKETYLNNFNKNTTRNYEIAKFLNSITDKNDKIFVWGDSVPIYALTGNLPPYKYVADYHISDFSNEEEVLQKLNTNNPKVIVVLAGAKDFPKLKDFLNRKYILIKTLDGSTIYILTKMKMGN